ncbi:glycoside hydrolase superfamily [Gilbertella persicaria]|uniref:glycoside hydrolase superfamily n=1 Tax=Gilbertella persicaria TaxID=101096 RepID=UPI00221E6A16|nr:glycoside hydrolase superfamily [Gilbertella persicaria]KAI8050146.1 glycoside hydrolase superfamily [Gilbertella persicaria]
MFIRYSTVAFILVFLTQCLLAGKAVIGYFPNWLYARYLVSNIQFDIYTHINYAFAVMVKSATPEWTDPENTNTQLPQLVAAAHKSNAKVLISIGGWSGSISFSDMAASSDSRKEFIDWCVDQIKQYDVDGFDIDWEYPGRQGAGCNQVDPQNDVQNYLTLLQELRKAIGSDKEITIAGYVQGFKTDAGQSSNELVTAIGDVLDRVNLMTYDINGAWNPETGPNSPLDASGGGDSFNSAIEFWTSAGVPASKLAAGLAFYGRSTTAKQDMTKSDSINQPQVQGQSPKGDSYDASWQDPNCSKDPGGLSGIWRFGNMLSEGVLDTTTTAKAPWIRTWDNASSTPWLFNPETKVFISYDDPLSIAAKVKSARSKGLGGIMIWSVDEDSEQNDLLKAAAQIN